MPQRPGHGDLGRRPAALPADGLQQADQPQVAGQQRFLVVGAFPPPVVGRQRRHALARHRTGQQTRRHRRVGDHAYVVVEAERQDLVLDLPLEQRVRRLQRCDGGDRLGLAQLIDVEVGHADPADLALPLEFGHHRPPLFNVLRRFGPVDLVEVDAVHAQPAQAGLALAPDGVGLEAVADLAVLVPNHAAFGEDVGALPHAMQGAGDDLLRAAEAVDGGRVDPVDAGVERLVNGGDGVGVVLGAPAPFISRAADGPGAEAHRRDVQVRFSQSLDVHCGSLFQGEKISVDGACAQAGAAGPRRAVRTLRIRSPSW